MFLIPHVNNQFENTYDSEKINEAGISTAVNFDIIHPIVGSLVVTGQEETMISIKKKIMIPFGDKSDYCEPNFLIMNHNRKLPIMIKQPFNTTSTELIPQDLVERIILYMMSSNSDIGVLSTYFETFIFHISEKDVESCKKTRNGKLSITIGLKMIKNTDESITPLLAIFSIMLQKTNSHNLKHLIKLFQKSKKEIDQDKEKRDNRISDKSIGEFSINLNNDEFEIIRGGSGYYEQLINVDKKAFINQVSLKPQTIKALEHDDKILLRILDPIAYCENMDQEYQEVLDDMNIYYQSQMMNELDNGKPNKYDPYVHWPLGGGFIKIFNQNKLEYIGYFTFHKPAILISNDLNKAKAETVKKDLVKLRELNMMWSKCVPPGFHPFMDRNQDYLLCDPNSGNTVFLDLTNPYSSDVIDYDLERVDQLIKR